MAMSTNLQRYLSPSEEVYTSVADRWDYAQGFLHGAYSEEEWAPGDSPAWYTTPAWRPVWDRYQAFSRRWRLGNARPFWVGWTEGNRGEPPIVEKEARLLSLAALAIAEMPAEDRPEICESVDEWDCVQIETWKGGRMLGITTGDPEYGCFTYLSAPNWGDMVCPNCGADSILRDPPVGEVPDPETWDAPVGCSVCGGAGVAGDTRAPAP